MSIIMGYNMNILLVTPAFFEKDIKGSGMPMATYRIAEGLKKMGHNPIIATGGKRDKYEIFHGIPLWRFQTEPIHTFQPRKIVRMIENCVVENYVLQKRVNQLLQELNIDLIQYAGNNGTGMFYNAKKIKIPAVMRVSSYYKFSYAGTTTYNGVEIMLHSFFERLAMKRIKNIYCPSKVMADYLKNELKQEIDVIETPFYIEEEHEDAFFVNTKMKDKKYLLYYGSVNPQKGVLILAKAINHILHRYKNLYIVFIGNDFVVRGKSVKNMIKHKIASGYANRVVFFQAMEHRRLYPFIKKSEFVLQPSYMENLSNACMEAMALGKIVIGTRGASYEQLITDGQNGFLMNRGSVSDLYYCVCRAMGLSKEEKECMGKLAQKRIEKLKPEISINILLQYYDKVCRNK